MLLTPNWWARHALVVVLVVAFAFLGRWQWDRAMAPTGSLQNLLYAIEWWVFAGLVVAGWAHLVRDEVRGVVRSRAEPVGGVEVPAFAARRASATAASPEQLPKQPVEPDDVDDELAAYNAYLAWLNANPRR